MIETGAGAGTATQVRPQRPEATDNNFHLLRLLFAAMVAVYHLTLLPGVPGWDRAIPFTSALAETGVQGFFILSGFLVYGSLERSHSLKLYAEKRVRRLYPAYATIVIACAIGALVASPVARADLPGVLRYLGWNLAFLNFMEPQLPGLFADNKVQEVNGALWTLKLEVLFYAILPLLAWLLRALGRWRWLAIALIYLGAEAWRYGFIYLAEHGRPLITLTIAQQLPGQMSFFITGVALYLVRDRLQRISWPVLLGAAIALAASYFSDFTLPLRGVSLGLLSIWVATGLGATFNAARFGDLSYGLYIIHFPLIQALTAAGLFAASPWLGVAGATAGAFVLALLMWRFVERPFLRPDSAYRKPSPGLA